MISNARIKRHRNAHAVRLKIFSPQSVHSLRRVDRGEDAGRADEGEKPRVHHFASPSSGLRPPSPRTRCISWNVVSGEKGIPTFDTQ